MSIEIPNKLTPVTSDEVAKAFSDAYLAIIGKRPSKSVLQSLLAHWDLETGGGASVHNYNFGNKKKTSNSTYFQQFRCWERDGTGEKIWYDPPHPACQFEAFLTPKDGAEAYITSLKRNDNWWKGLESGTLKGFVEGLSVQPYAYFTGKPDAYLSILQSRAERYTEQAKKYAATPIGKIVTGGTIGIGLAYAFYRWKRDFG